MTFTESQSVDGGRNVEIGLLARICRVCETPFTTDDGRRVHCSLECRKTRRREHDANNQTKHRHRHALRALCRQTLKNAIVLGKVRRPERCEACGALAFVEAHHSDYERPFFVEWLCRRCHADCDDGHHFGLKRS